MCTVHENRPIEYYCEDDEMIICSRCVIQGNHKDHNISSIEDKVRIEHLHESCRIEIYMNLTQLTLKMKWLCKNCCCCWFHQKKNILKSKIKRNTVIYVLNIWNVRLIVLPIIFQNKYVIGEMESNLQVANYVLRRLKKVDKVGEELTWWCINTHGLLNHTVLISSARNLNVKCLVISICIYSGILFIKVPAFLMG